MSRLVGRTLQGTLGWVPMLPAVWKLFQDTPDDKKLCFDKEEVFGITDGGQSPMEDHPVFMEMFEILITCALCYSLNFCGLLLLNPLIAVLGWQVITNRSFCLRRRNLKRWEKPRCFRTGYIQASKRSSIFSVCTALHRRQFFPLSFIPVWRTNCGTGGGSTGHKINTMLFIHPGLEH